MKFYPSLNINNKTKSGGLSNFMYACEINRTLEDEPGKVLLRIYGAIRGGDSLLNEIIQAKLIGQQKLGPRVYGVFKHGRLEEYINVKINFFCNL